MLNSPILEFAIAISFIYLLLSILVAALNELRVYVRKIRGKRLRVAIEEVFNDPYNKNYAELLYNHPLIDRMRKTQKDLPSYLSSSVFASCLIDVIGRESYESRAVQDPITLLIKMNEVNKDDGKAKEENSYFRFKKGVEAMKYSDMKIMLSGFVDEADDVHSLKTNLEKWFNDYMDRVSGWYKTSMQIWLFGIGLCVAVFMNVDSIHLARELYKNDKLRTNMANVAQNYVETNKQVARTPQSLDSLVRNVDSIYTQLGAYNLPIGWDFTKEQVKIKSLPSDRAYDEFRKSNWGWVFRIIGWLITAFALSFGAPFWFAAVNKLVDIRKSGAKPKVETKSS